MISLLDSLKICKLSVPGLNKHRSSYNDAMKKLQHRSWKSYKYVLKKLRKLGAKASKTLPQSLIDDDENLLEE